MDVSPCKNVSYEQKRDAMDVVSLVDDLLKKAISSGASDVHFEPTDSELLVKFRLDGVLNPIERVPRGLSENVIARLKVLGGLLTYRSDIPQEGRIEISKSQGDGVMDQRLAVFPTIHGQRAVVRLFYSNKELMELEQLGFSDEISSALKRLPPKTRAFCCLPARQAAARAPPWQPFYATSCETFPAKVL